MQKKKVLKIQAAAIRKNKQNGELGTWWTNGGVILIDDETITLKYLGTMAVFNRKSVKYYRDRDEELLIRRILRLHDEEQDFSILMFPSAFEKFMKAMEKTDN